MHSKMSIGPAFRGSIAVRVIEALEGNKPIFAQPKIYQTSYQQDTKLDMFIGSLDGPVTQKGKELSPDGINQLFKYINDLQLTNSNRTEQLVLDVPKDKDIHISKAGTHVVVRGEHPQKGDTVLDLCLEILGCP